MDVSVRSGRIAGRLRPPGAKAIAQRAILLACSKGGSVLNVPENDDIDRLCGGLRELGYRVDEEPGERHVSGSLGAAAAHIDMGHNATGARCLLAHAALRGSRTVIDGSARLRERPMRPLCEALRKLGVTIEGNSLPLALRGPMAGREVQIQCDASSQFATALILLVERVPGLRVQVVGRESLSYVTLTAHIQRGFETPYTVENDYSSAAPFAVGAAITDGDLLLEGMSWSSPQPDSRLFGILNRMGAHVTQEEQGIRVRGGRKLRGAELDLSSCPDLAPLIGVLGAMAEGETRVTNAPHLVYKESDRIQTTTHLVRTLGGDAEPRPDGFIVRGGSALHGGRVSSEGDHRIAMAAAIMGLVHGGLTVTGAEAVAKSYPGFFEDLDALTA